MSREAADRATRRETVLHFYGRERGRESLDSVPAHTAAYLELPGLHLRAEEEDVLFDRANVEQTVGHVEAQEDCTDFGLHALIPMLLRHGTGGSGLLPDDLERTIENALLSSVYWYDEPGVHDLWFSTENHQVLWHAAELLVGQEYPASVFEDGRTGREHRAHAASHLDRWLDWRRRFGFSEWLADPYYDEDLTALANLAAFADDESIAGRARKLVHLLVFDLALNTFHGVFGCTHGRTYPTELLDPRRSALAPLGFLLFGEGAIEYRLSRSAILLALDDYEPPAVVGAVRNALGDWTGAYHQHHGLSVERAPEFGLDPGTTADQQFFWGALAMGHRDVVEAAMATITGSYRRRLAEILPAATYHQHAADHDRYEPDPNNTAMTGADVYTYRTPAYLLSCAQDYRKGKMGFQQHVWQATVDDATPIFTNHPRSVDGLDSWGGNGVLPRAAAHRNLLVCRYEFEPGVLPYDIPDVPGWDASLVDADFTHAFLPRAACDGVVTGADQVCAKLGDAYVSLRATTPLSWVTPDEEVTALLPYDGSEPYELVADGGQTTWVCELGTASEYDGFEEFAETMLAADLTSQETAISYDSPSLGPVTFGWDDPLVVDGDRIPLSGYARLDTPYCTAELGTSRYEIRCENESWTIDFGDE